MKWFVFAMLFGSLSVFSMEAAYEEQLSLRMRVIKVLCDSGQEPGLCSLWDRMMRVKEVYGVALKEQNQMKERLEELYSRDWDDYMGSLCLEGLEDDPESGEDDSLVYFCERMDQLIEARGILNEARTLVEIVKATAGVEGALDIEQAEYNVRMAEENYNIIKGILTGLVCGKTDEFPEAKGFCLFLEESKRVERNYEEQRELLKSMNVGRMDYKMRRLCQHNKYILPCDELKLK